MAAAKEEAYKDAVEGAAIDKAVENAEILELPEEMIHEEVHRSVNEFLETCNVKVSTPDMYFQITGTTQEDLHKQYEGEAESRTKTNLVIEAVAKAEGFDASEEEIQKKSSNWLQTTTWKLLKVQSLLSADMLKHDITIKKLLNWSQAQQQLNNLQTLRKSLQTTSASPYQYSEYSLRLSSLVCSWFHLSISKQKSHLNWWVFLSHYFPKISLRSASVIPIMAGMLSQFSSVRM